MAGDSGRLVGGGARRCRSPDGTMLWALVATQEGSLHVRSFTVCDPSGKIRSAPFARSGACCHRPTRTGTGNFLRSAEMEYVSFIIQEHLAHDCIERLGEVGTVQVRGKCGDGRFPRDAYVRTLRAAPMRGRRRSVDWACCAFGPPRRGSRQFADATPVLSRPACSSRT